MISYVVQRVISIVALAFGISVIVFLIIQLRLIVIPILVAVLVGAPLVPFSGLLQRHRWPKCLAVTTAMLSALVVVGGLLTLGITQIVRGSDELAAQSLVAWDQFREWLLSYEADTPALTALAPGLTPEMVAAVSKLMRNHDLVTVSAKCSVVTGFRTTLGLPGRLSSRLQPNHPNLNHSQYGAGTQPPSPACFAKACTMGSSE